MGGSSDQSKSVREELWLDPNVQSSRSKEFGTIIKQSPKFGQHKPCDPVNCRSKAPRTKGASLIPPAVGTNLGQGVFEVQPVRGGACVPSGEDNSEVGVGLLNGHTTKKHIEHLNKTIEYGRAISFYVRNNPKKGRNDPKIQLMEREWKGGWRKQLLSLRSLKNLVICHIGNIVFGALSCDHASHELSSSPSVPAL